MIGEDTLIVAVDIGMITSTVYCCDIYGNGTKTGYTFRARRSKNRWGKFFINFCPAVSNKAAKEIRQDMRQWALHLSSDKTFDDARCLRPVAQLPTSAALMPWRNVHNCIQW